MTRLDRVRAQLRARGFQNTLISDLLSIEYLIDRSATYVGERLFALLVPVEGEAVLYANALFPVEPGEGFRVVVHTDSDDPTAQLAQDLPAGVLGVDRFFAAQFLLPILEARPDIQPKLGAFAVEETRMIKDEAEKAAMRRASAINDEVFAEIPSLLREGMTELELGKAIAGLFAEKGDPAHANVPLVCFGENSAEPHHSSGQTVLKAPSVVLVDGGQNSFGYNSDMTRTFFFGEPDETMKQVYAIVLEANRRGRAAVKPGVPLSEIDRAARDYITQMGYGPYFTHRVGHGIGCDVHEEPSVSGSNDRPAEVGMCFSIEPGIYLPGRFGVRIEDLVLVTEEGCETLNHYHREMQVL